MSSQPTNLFKLARNKLHLSVAGKDSCNLHRWVLLKNSISSSTLTLSSPSASQPDAHSATEESEEYFDLDEEDYEEEADSFMFPDASGSSSAENVEAQWLDSLLADLGEDADDDDFMDGVSILQDDEEHLLSPLSSPMSSSDNLVQTEYYPPPTTVSLPYPIPYPPFHPPLIHSYPLSASSEDDDMSVPEAIEDTSDDESEAAPLSTPSLSYSSSSGSSSLDPASVPLPGDAPRLHVYIDTDDFNPFDVDPLPFPIEHFNHYSYNPFHQEC